MHPRSHPGHRGDKSQSERDSWTGLTVVPGRVLGAYVLIDLSQTSPSKVPTAPIRVFRRATPETVEYFEGALGLIFVEGGLLSHACSVARERGIPTATRMGTDLWSSLRLSPPGEIELCDGLQTGQAVVRLVLG